ncbi:MAG TPA: SMI1/KNR4 family protein [Gemmataceae bacterium]|nr:SMI1/KNR4 family protein [Gemmataceae bacterium]
MPIKQLLALIAPPARPVDNEGNWQAAEIVVGAEYPPDFRDLITRYGTGAFFQGHLKVFNPLTIVGLALIKQNERYLRQHWEGPYALPLPVHPEAPGLLPWGHDENGNDYCWLTKGRPEKWPVVFLGHGQACHPFQFRTDITGFLAGYATDTFKELIQPDAPMTEAMREFTRGRSAAEDARLAAKDRNRR